MSNFWRCCPLQREEFPKTDCHLGRRGSGCPWFIHSSTDKYCFWSYIRRNSAEDGSMQTHTPIQIAKLLGLSAQEVDEHLAKALATLRNMDGFEEFAEFL